MIHPENNAPTRSARRNRNRGFTLVEVLATILLMAIAFPAITQCINIAQHVSIIAREKTEAAGLAHAQLSQILADQTWQQGAQSGNFAEMGNDYAMYNWTLNVQPWTQDDTELGLEQLDMTVTWLEGVREYSVTLSSVAYMRGISSATT